MAKKANKKWFKKVRGSYLPSSWQGNFIYLVYVAYIITVPIVWYQRGHNTWELLVHVVPAIFLSAILTQYIASKTS